ncbi:MAG: guanine deaminase, partial [Sphingomonadales bacterium]|nr:guanine deaminase [Sphingomonadales bacterium]
MKAFRGEILSVPDDPGVAGRQAIRHYEDGLLVVEDGLVLACGPYADLAGTFAEAETETLDGLIVPGF